MKVIITKNSGYKWYSDKQVYFKGYFQLDGEPKVYATQEATDFLSHVETYEQLQECLKRIDGVYSFVIQKPNCVLAAVDRSRSMPLFFDKKATVISDSAEEIRKELNIAAENVDENQYLALMSADYLIFDHTVYADIRQLDVGEVAEFAENSIRVQKYFFHICKVKQRSDAEIKKELMRVATKAFLRLKAAINGRPVVLSMSGGYDSRFVGCMLKRVGIEDVSCYTYGKPDSFEVIQSRQNAEALGFRWTYVDYTDEEMLRVLDETGQEYLASYTTHDYIGYMQNFPAVRKLQEQQWIKPGAVFITGLCGDMPTGNYVLPYDSKMEYTPRTAAERLYQLIFTRFRMAEQFREQWLTETESKIKKLPLAVCDYQSWTSAVDCIYTGTCHSRWFMHMNSVHGFFDYEWLLPYWDAELLQAWYQVPAEKRINQGLYEDWLLNDICKEWGIGQKKHRASYSNNETVRKLKYFVGSIISFALLNSGIPFKRSYDYNNFACLELQLFQKLKCKRAVIYKKAGMPHLLNQYVLQNKYGVENMKKARKRVKG